MLPPCSGSGLPDVAPALVQQLEHLRVLQGPGRWKLIHKRDDLGAQKDKAQVSPPQELQAGLKEPFFDPPSHCPGVDGEQLSNLFCRIPNPIFFGVVENHVLGLPLAFPWGVSTPATASLPI